MNKKHLLSPGPTAVSPDVTLAMAAPLIHHRGPKFKEIFGAVCNNLKWLFQTEQDVYTLTCSGTGAFEAALTNFTKRGETMLSIGGGKFGTRWGEMGEAFEMNVIHLPVEWGKSADPDAVEAILKKHDVAIVSMCASETSTGAYHPVKEIAELCKPRNALCAIDGITAIGVHDIPMDAWGIDILISGSQKAFSLPPGLGFLAASEKAWARIDESDHSRFYFDLRKERSKITDAQTAFTPAISLIVGLDRVLRNMFDEGLDAIFARHTLLAHATRAAVSALGCSLVAERPSNSVTAAHVPDGLNAPAVVVKMRDDLGVTIAGGQDQLKPTGFRIGHLGYSDESDIWVAIGALETAFLALGADFEPGTGLTAAQKTLIGKPA